MSNPSLYNTLIKLGASQGDAGKSVVGMIPPEYAATKIDLAKVKSDVTKHTDKMATKVELAEVKSDVKKHTDNVATKADIIEVKADITEVKADMATKADITEVKADITKLDADMKRRIAELKVTLLIALMVYISVGVGVATFLIKT